MSQNNAGWGRALLIGIVVLVGAPALMFLATALWWGTSASAQDAARRERAEAQRAVANAQKAHARLTDAHPDAVERPRTDYGYRPVYETEYREQVVEVPISVYDAKAGKTLVEQQKQIRQYPVTTQRWVKSITTHDTQIMKLTSELREMADDDEARDGKMKQLRQRLALEFDHMHETQLKDIEKTAERLDSLKQTHQKRGENKDKIVQRRIDELMGKADTLRWDPGRVERPAPQPGFTIQYRQAGPTATGVQRPIGSPGPPTVPQFRAGTTPLSSTTQRELHTQRITTQPGQQQYGTRMEPTAPAPVRSVRATGVSQPKVELPRAELPAADPVAPRGQSSTVRSSTVRSTPSLSAMSTRVEVVSASVINKLFELARNSANAEADLAETTARLKQIQRLGSKGAITSSEIQTAERNADKLRRQVELNKIHLEALSDTIHRDLEFAKAALSSAKEKRAMIEQRFKTGSIQFDALLDAKLELVKVEQAYETAQASLRQLETVFKLDEKKETASEAGGGESSDELGSGDDADPAKKSRR